MTVTDDGTTVTVTVPLNRLSTGIALRDQNVDKALAVATYPTATLAVPGASLTFLNQKSPAGFAKDRSPFTGARRRSSFTIEPRKPARPMPWPERSRST